MGRKERKVAPIWNRLKSDSQLPYRRNQKDPAKHLTISMTLFTVQESPTARMNEDLISHIAALRPRLRYRTTQSKNAYPTGPRSSNNGKYYISIA